MYHLVLDFLTTLVHSLEANARANGVQLIVGIDDCPESDTDCFKLMMKLNGRVCIHTLWEEGDAFDDNFKSTTASLLRQVEGEILIKRTLEEPLQTFVRLN